MKATILILGFLRSMVIVFSVVNAQEYTHSITQRFLRGNYEVKWFTTDTRITFEVTAPTTGWIGLGFNSRNQLQGADLFVAWLDGNKVLQFQDSLVHDHIPNLGITLWRDSQQNYNGVIMTESITADRTTSTLKFYRELSTCDFAQDYKLNTSTVHLILAFDSADPSFPDASRSTTNLPQFLSLVNSSTSGYVITPYLLLEKSFRTNFQTAPIAPANAWSVTSDDVVPNIQTSFWPLSSAYYYSCNVQRVPQFDDTRSFIAYSPVVQRKVYAINVYMCPKDMDLSSQTGKQIDCTTNTSLLNVCQELVASWGMSGKTIVFPEDVGYPIGKTLLGNRFVVLQVMYDRLMVEQRTRSGLTFHLTDTDIKHRAGELMITSDNNYKLVIPPKTKEFRVRTICDTQCTVKYLPGDGIHLFSVMHYTREFGRQVRTRLIREGKEVQLISEDSAYTSALQTFRELDPPVKVLPGDKIMVECSYNTSAMIAPGVWKFGGNATTDEMCSAAFHYYPRVEGFNECGSTPEPRHIFPIFSVSDYESTFEVSGNNSQHHPDAEDVKDAAKLLLQKIQEGDKCLVPRLQDLYYNKRHLPKCGAINLKLIKINKIELLPVPKDDQCPEAELPKKFAYDWPSSCHDIVYRDEIEEQIMCRPPVEDSAHAVIASLANVLFLAVAAKLFVY